MNRWRMLQPSDPGPARRPRSRGRVTGSPADTPKQLEQLRKEVELHRKLLRIAAELQDVKRRLAELERRVDEMQRPQVRTSNFPPNNTGTIRLQNRLSVPATIIVGGIPQRLQPGEQRDLQNQPAGPFEFEAIVDGFGSLQPRATRVLQTRTDLHRLTYLPRIVGRNFQAVRASPPDGLEIRPTTHCSVPGQCCNRNSRVFSRLHITPRSPSPAMSTSRTYFSTACRSVVAGQAAQRSAGRVPRCGASSSVMLLHDPRDLALVVGDLLTQARVVGEAQHLQDRCVRVALAVALDRRSCAAAGRTAPA